MSESPYIFEVTTDNFEQIVIQGSRQQPVLVDFWASWCQPCQMLMPLLAKLADEYRGRFILAKLNTEENQAIAAQFGIRSIPNVKLFIDGQQVDEFAGALPESAIREFLEKHLPRESDNSIEEAMQLFREGDTKTALEILTRAQSSDPDNPRIALAMAQIHAANGNVEAAEHALDTLPDREQEKPEVTALRNRLFFAREAPPAEEQPKLRERLEADPQDNEARYKMAMALIQEDQSQAAVEELLNILAKDRNFRDGAARDALFKLFDTLGDDPVVAQARRRLFNMLH